MSTLSVLERPVRVASEAALGGRGPRSDLSPGCSGTAVETLALEAEPATNSSYRIRRG